MSLGTLDKTIHHLAIVIGLIYIYQGLVTKIWLYSFDAMQMIYHFGFSESNSRAISILLGLSQMAFGIGIIKDANQTVMHYINIAVAFIACLVVMLVFPTRLTDAFNPLMMYFALCSLSVISINLITHKDKP